MKTLTSIPIKVDESFHEDSLNQGLYIFIIHAERIPPHLGIINEGKVFDINVRGKKIGVPVKGFINVLKNKNIAGLFLKLIPSNNSDLEQIIHHQIAKFDQVESNVTCLAPVKGMVEHIYTAEAANASFVFELIPILYQHNLVEKTIHYQLEHAIENGIFNFQTYTMEDIQNRVNRLNQKAIDNR